MNEFEKYPELAEQMQEYAALGRFGNWQKFTDVLNETLRQTSKNLAQPDVGRSELLIDFFKWLNALEELQYTEKGIKFYVDMYLKSINSR
jgi:hypothetical protein